MTGTPAVNRFFYFRSNNGGQIQLVLKNYLMVKTIFSFFKFTAFFDSIPKHIFPGWITQTVIHTRRMWHLISFRHILSNLWESVKLCPNPQIPKFSCRQNEFWPSLDQINKKNCHSLSMIIQDKTDGESPVRPGNPPYEIVKIQ